MPVHIADRPDICAAQGLGAMMEGRIRPLTLEPISS
jgi:rod shape-determining protein MreB